MHILNKENNVFSLLLEVIEVLRMKGFVSLSHKPCCFVDFCVSLCLNSESN